MEESTEEGSGGEEMKEKMSERKKAEGTGCRWSKGKGVSRPVRVRAGWGCHQSGQDPGPLRPCCQHLPACSPAAGPLWHQGSGVGVSPQGRDGFRRHLWPPEG